MKHAIVGSVTTRLLDFWRWPVRELAVLVLGQCVSLGLANGPVYAQPVPGATAPAGSAPAPLSSAVPASAPPTALPAVPLAPASAAAPAAPAAASVAVDKKPRKFWIDGRYRELKKGEVRPYRPPQMLPDSEPQPSIIKVFEAQKLEDGEPQILARPYYGSPMLGTVSPGTRMAVRGEVMAKTTRYCHSKRWLALVPFGWICAEHGKPVLDPPTTTPAYQIVPGERVPYRYHMVSSREPLPMWTSLDDLKAGNEPERNLERGDSVAIEKTIKHDGQSYYQTVEGKVLPIHGTYQMEATSSWHGILIDDKVPLPFGWILSGEIKAQAEPGQGPSILKLPRRTRVDILEETTIKYTRYLKVRVSAVQSSAFPVATAPPLGSPAAVSAQTQVAPIGSAAPVAAAPAAPGGPAAAQSPGASATAPAAPAVSENPPVWVNAGLVNEVRLQARPADAGQVSRWFDADLGEQVLVAYDGDKPVFATLVSSGRNNATPLGNYPVWARVSAITMKSQPYDDKPYFVNMVPWSTFFQAHNAIHGAYWHDRFGSVKSHGCINVSPLDARFVFEWLDPKVPFGWTSLRPADLRESPMLHVWDSHRKPSFKQERPIGPPDRDDEAERLDAAEKRRAEAVPPGAPSTAGAAAPAGNGAAVPPAGKSAPVPAAPSSAPSPSPAGQVVAPPR